MTEQTELDWQNEVENLYDSSDDDVDYFKPPQGRTEITFLDDGEEYSTQKDWDEEENDYVVFRVEVDGEEFKWEMKKGQTPGSKFGMIARYAAAKGGLAEKTVTWFRQGEEQNTNHMLLELDEIDEEEEDAEDGDEEGDEDDREAVFDDEDGEDEAETPIVDEE
jgi:hypothetical protein